VCFVLAVQLTADMTDRKYFLLNILVVILTASSYVGMSEAALCRRILQSNPNAPTGAYIGQSKSGNSYEVWCEMGLNGGGYTFIHPQYIDQIQNYDIESSNYNETSILLVPNLACGSPVYIVLDQLPQFSHIPLSVQLNSSVGYTTPPNVNVIGTPYLFIGFQPYSVVTNSAGEPLGVQANGQNLTYNSVNETADSYVVLFPNFKEVNPAPVAPGVQTYVNTTFCHDLKNSALPIPSGRTMPPEYFMFAQVNFGGTAGCSFETNPATRTRTGIYSFAVGIL